MTAQTRSTNKGKFEQGDTPQGSDYVDLIDSFVSLSDTTVQAVSSPLTITGAIGASTTVSANSVEASAASFTLASAATFHAAAAHITVVSASTGTFAIVSANTVNASAMTMSLGSAANLTIGILTMATANATASVVAGTGQTIPTTAAGFITVQVCGQTVGIPYFTVA